MEKIFEYKAPDIDTMLLLQNREAWTQNPSLFVSSQPGISSHPMADAALECIAYDQDDAWGVMLRRCRCIVLSLMQKYYKITAEQIAMYMMDSPIGSYPVGVLHNKVKSLLDAGSKYEWLELQLGRGVTFLLGKDINNDTWEKRLTKYGKNDRSRAAIQHLKSIGLTKLASEFEGMRNSIIAHMLMLRLQRLMPEFEANIVAKNIVFGPGETVVAENEIWAQSLSVYGNLPCFDTIPQSCDPW